MNGNQNIRAISVGRTFCPSFTNTGEIYLYRLVTNDSTRGYRERNDEYSTRSVNTIQTTFLSSGILFHLEHPFLEFCLKFCLQDATSNIFFVEFLPRVSATCERFWITDLTKIFQGTDGNMASSGNTARTHTIKLCFHNDEIFLQVPFPETARAIFLFFLATSQIFDAQYPAYIFVENIYIYIYIVSFPSRALMQISLTDSFVFHESRIRGSNRNETKKQFYLLTVLPELVFFFF